MVEAAEVEERLQARALDPGEVDKLAFTGRDLVHRRLELRARVEFTAIARGGALEEDGVGDPRVGVLGLEVDRRVEAVPEAVDVHCVCVEVLAQCVRVLDQQAERLRVVRRREGAGALEQRLRLASLAARRVGDVAPDDDGVENRLQARVRLICRCALVHAGTSTWATSPVGVK
ncbi:MAG: hypothetical protein IV100_11745 [Myxococcales bacterium]|nr:hypothetical protein [Myxococcales bacterium]